MRKSCFLLAAILFLQSIFVFAAPIDSKIAAKVAANFYKQCALKNGVDYQKATVALNDVTSQTPYQNIFVFNAPNGNGFVLVAGDDRSLPILGYSISGTFNYEKLPVNARQWIAHYENEIEYVKTIDAKPYEITAEEWESLQTGTYTFAKGTSVGPLLTTKWGQMASNDGKIATAYNKLCPYDNTKKKYTYVGCVATSMAQIMKYWNWPKKGVGSHSYTPESYPRLGKQSADFENTTYDWDNMPDELMQSSTDAQIKAVATLMYHCGVAVDMDYGYLGSGAFDDAPEFALKNYFSYAPTASLRSKEVYTADEWMSMLKKELDNKHPLYYSGEDNEGGHAFVCDGYDEKNYFHFNWGWEGEDDGFFTVDKLVNRTDIIDFSYYQFCIVGIQPDTMNIDSNDILKEPLLALKSAFKLNKKAFSMDEEISLQAQVINYGTVALDGNLMLVVCNSSNKQVASFTKQAKLNFYDDITLKNNFTISVPGDYYAFITYSNDTTDISTYTPIKDNTTYKNRVDFTINSIPGIELGAEYQISTDTLFVGDSTTFSMKLKNATTGTWSGEVKLVLISLDGQGLQFLGGGSIEQLASLATYTFNCTSVIDAPVGKAHLLSYYKTQGETDWKIVNGNGFANPMTVVVDQVMLTPDEYEPNNSFDNAYFLDTMLYDKKLYSIDANIHCLGDFDYYCIVLPEGSDYVVDAKIFNADNSTYSADVLFVAYLNDEPVRSANQDTMPTMQVENGGLFCVCVCVLAPSYLKHTTGTYKLEITISRVPMTGIQEQEMNQWTVYPNPAQEKINLQVPENVAVEQLDVIALNGQVVRSFDKNDRDLNIQNLPNGAYLLRIRTNDAIVTKKWIKR